MLIINITEVITSQVDQTPLNQIYPDPEIERDVYEGPGNNPILRNVMGQDPDIMEVLRLMQNEQMRTNPSSANNTVPPTLVETPFSKTLKSPIPIVIIALITYSLFILNIESMIGGAVLSFFITWEILAFTLTAFVLKSSMNNTNSFLNFLPLFLPRLNPHALQLILKILTFSNKIMRDLAMFLFTFVVFHISYSYLVNGESFQVILDKDFNNLFAR